MTDKDIEAWVDSAPGAARVEVLKSISRAERLFCQRPEKALAAAKRAAAELEIIHQRWLARENMILPRSVP